MAKGLPKWAIKEAKARGAKNIFAYAWTLVKRKRKKGSRKSNPKKTVRRGGRKMTKRKTRRRKMTIPMAAVGGALAGIFVPPSGANKSALTLFMEGNLESGLKHLLWNYTGYNPYNNTWNIMAATGLQIAIGGIAAHKIASWLGINRALGNAKIPLIRI